MAATPGRTKPWPWGVPAPTGRSPPSPATSNAADGPRPRRRARCTWPAGATRPTCSSAAATCAPGNAATPASSSRPPGRSGTWPSFRTTRPSPATAGSIGRSTAPRGVGPLPGPGDPAERPAPHGHRPGHVAHRRDAGADLRLRVGPERRRPQHQPLPGHKPRPAAGEPQLRVLVRGGPLGQGLRLPEDGLRALDRGPDLADGQVSGSGGVRGNTGWRPLLRGESGHPPGPVGGYSSASCAKLSSTQSGWTGAAASIGGRGVLDDVEPGPPQLVEQRLLAHHVEGCHRHPETIELRGVVPAGLDGLIGEEDDPGAASPEGGDGLPRPRDEALAQVDRAVEVENVTGEGSHDRSQPSRASCSS